jgi:uncharacterized protein (DUF2062 family)
MQIDLLGILNSLWQVLAVGLLFGAGLPALFALGIRARGTTRASGPLGAVGPDGAAPTSAAAPSAAGRFVSWLCFGLCLAVAAFGIIVIVFGKQIFGG